MNVVKYLQSGILKSQCVLRLQLIFFCIIFTTTNYALTSSPLPDIISVDKIEKTDSLIQNAVLCGDFDLLKTFYDNYTGQIRINALNGLHNLIINLGNSNSLKKFYKVYGDGFSEGEKENELHISLLVEKLQLQLPFKIQYFEDYDQFIKIAAPRYKAFVAIQNMIAADIENKSWSSAAETVRNYRKYFALNPTKIDNLLEILNSKTDKSVVIKPISDSINTPEGGEYSPVFPSGEKVMYFCGTGRTDNTGGEDIFFSEKSGKTWLQPKIIPELSSRNFNDSPVSISPDGTKLLFVRSGKMYESSKTKTGWTEAEQIKGVFNNQILDGSYTADGKGLIFSSVKNFPTEWLDPTVFQNGKLQPSDIFISLLDDNNNWSAPINLGKQINTPYCERSPFLHADLKTLYFSSDGHGGLGKTDVFKSERLSDTCWTCWSKPINLGKELNTTASDIGYKISVDGKNAFFARSKNTNNNSSILLLLDASGSVSGWKFEALKTRAVDILKKTTDLNVETALLTFATNCNFPLVDSCGFNNSFTEKINFIKNIQPSGKTTTSAALTASVKYLERNARYTSNSFILLLTDEDVCTCAKPDRIYSLAEEIKRNFNISTLVFDFTEDSILSSNLELKNVAGTGIKLHKLFLKQQQENIYERNLNLSGDEDIFTATLPLRMRPGPVSSISGKIESSKEQIPVLKIELNDLETEKNVGIIYSDPVNGSYYITLPHGKHYEYYVKSDSLLSESKNINVKGATNSIYTEDNLKVFSLNELIEKGEAVRINNVFFDFDKSILLDNSKSELKRWAEIIKQEHLIIELSGHTDNIGNEVYNFDLSQKRAEAVREFLISLGCNEKNITAVGYGESKPLFSNNDIKGRSGNRRVEMKIKSNK